MSDNRMTTTRDLFGAPDLPARALGGVRTRRTFAILIDLIVLSLFVGLAIFAFATLGLITFGLTWLLIPLTIALYPLFALLYNGMTMSGWRHATPGMRMMDLEVRVSDGSHVSFLHAAVHAVLFYLSWTLTPLVLLVSLIAPNKRCLHDILSNMVVIRRPD